ncbi:hypothetical protein JOB18_018829 [Solea senegalensis]|uniref:Uncharacterized protein n=1 Tax=Solea senegalensis TaxID=28829 RepID=A0AAV6QVT5_SOLSE|nr:hypothetical protein JOB18_018829 [Solea senegalensis]
MEITQQAEEDELKWRQVVVGDKDTVIGGIPQEGHVDLISNGSCQGSEFQVKTDGGSFPFFKWDRENLPGAGAHINTSTYRTLNLINLRATKLHLVVSQVTHHQA